MPAKPTKRVLHTFVIKKIEDAGDGQLCLVGTIVQRVLDLEPKDLNENEKPEDWFRFKYRLNEVSADTESQVHLRRVEPLKLKENGEDLLGTRSTYEVKIPLLMDSLISLFPFKINVATATIELSSTEYRPDLVLSQNERRTVLNIQNLMQENVLVQERAGQSPQKKGPRNPFALYPRNMIKIMDKIDKTKAYDFMSPHPLVCYQYDNEKEYCPRFSLTFYVVSDGFDQFVQLVMPIILVAVIALLNTWNEFSAETATIAEHLSITSALTLTVVFLLPQTLDQSNRKGNTSQDAFVILFFVSLLLSSIPRKLIGSVVPEIIGVTLMITAILVFPCWNLYKYRKIRMKIANDSISQHDSERHRFLTDDSEKRFDKEGNKIENLFTVREFVESKELRGDLYEVANENKDADKTKTEPEAEKKDETDPEADPAEGKPGDKDKKNGDRYSLLCWADAPSLPTNAFGSSVVKQANNVDQKAAKSDV